MAREIKNPRIMLLSGGIDYTRAEHRIASLNTLLEQEEKYLQILVGKITKLKPNVLMVSRAVSRKAQELLLETNIILLQHVKPCLDGFNITPNRSNNFVQHRPRDGELLISFYLKSVKIVSKHLESLLCVGTQYAHLLPSHPSVPIWSKGTGKMSPLPFSFIPR